MTKSSSTAKGARYADRAEALRVAERPHCGHCGRHFDPRLSSAGERGICRECFDA